VLCYALLAAFQRRAGASQPSPAAVHPPFHERSTCGGRTREEMHSGIANMAVLLDYGYVLIYSALLFAVSIRPIPSFEQEARREITFTF